jgi:MFS family permease
MLFGLCATLISVTTNLAGLLVLRTFLGMGEAILTLGFLYLSFWYRPEELALRSGIAAFSDLSDSSLANTSTPGLMYLSTPIAGFTSGLVAYGVQKNLQHAHGKSAWQWLFIVEGIPTLVLALAMLFLLPNFPDKVAQKGHIFFKRAEDRKLVLERQKAGQNVANAKIKPNQILIGLKDPKSYLGAMAVAAPALGVTAFNIFLPTFIKEFGFSSRKLNSGQIHVSHHTDLWGT